jgi:hypothetical protein
LYVTFVPVIDSDDFVAEPGSPTYARLGVPEFRLLPLKVSRVDEPAGLLLPAVGLTALSGAPLTVKHLEHTAELPSVLVTRTSRGPVAVAGPTVQRRWIVVGLVIPVVMSPLLSVGAALAVIELSGPDPSAKSTAIVAPLEKPLPVTVTLPEPPCARLFGATLVAVGVLGVSTVKHAEHESVTNVEVALGGAILTS